MMEKPKVPNNPSDKDFAWFYYMIAEWAKEDWLSRNPERADDYHIPQDLEDYIAELEEEARLEFESRK